MASALASRLSSWLQLPVKRRLACKNDEQNSQSIKKQRLAKENDVKRQTTTHTRSIAASKQLHKEAKRHDHGMGWFINLPTELLHMVYHYLDNTTLQNFSSLSKDLNTNVVNYFLSKPGLMQLLNISHTDKYINTNNPLYFTNAGKLVTIIELF